MIARRASSQWDRTFLSDGVSDVGDIMVWIQHIEQVADEGGRWFIVSSHTVSEGKQPAGPLVSFAAPGMPMSAYMTHSRRNPFRWKLKTATIADVRRNAVLMSLNPSGVFVDHCHASLDVTDVDRAPTTEHGTFSSETVIQRSIRAPIVYLEGRRRVIPALKVAKVLEGRIVAQSFDNSSRRYSCKGGMGRGYGKEAPLDGPWVISTTPRFLLLSATAI